MANLNRIFLIGNLTRDPELRYIPSGTAVVSFGMAINTTLPRPASGGEAKEDVCFVKIVVWGKQAETCKQYLSKGRLVLVEGRLVYRSWEQDGKTRSTLEVKADRVQFLGGGGRRGEGGPDREGEPAAAALVTEGNPEVGTTEEPGPSESAGDDEPPF